MPIVLKSGGLNLLEPSGPVQVCNGIALPLYTICVKCLSYGICSVSFDGCARQHIKTDNPCTLFGGGDGSSGY